MYIKISNIKTYFKILFYKTMDESINNNEKNKTEQRLNIYIKKLKYYYYIT